MRLNAFSTGSRRLDVLLPAKGEVDERMARRGKAGDRPAVTPVGRKMLNLAAPSAAPAANPGFRRP